MKLGRKIIECKVCHKTKLHYGLGMCSSCLRKHKRQTKPTFYLGTCYSEMSRRVKTFDPIRPNYYGLHICTKNEFIMRFQNDENFLRLFKSWQQSEFKRKYAPSIDRIDNDEGYTIDNLQFISQSENSRKDYKKPVLLFKNGEFVSEFESTVMTAEYLGIAQQTVSEYALKGRKYKGYEFIYAA